MMKPPPTPRKPVRKPTTMPAEATRRTTASETRCGPGRAATVGRRRVVRGPRRSDAASASAGACPCSASGWVWTRVLVSMAAAATSIKPAKQTSRRFGSTRAFRAVPANDAAIPATPKPKPARQRTWPALAWPRAAAAAVIPTMTRLPVVADCAALPEGVDERRHREDGAAAAEGAEAQPDQQAQPHRQGEGHAVITNGVTAPRRARRRR